MVYSRIRDLREDRDLKQQDLADYLNCSQVCYSRYENGQRDIPLETISKIADFYNVSVDYLLNRTDCPARGDSGEYEKSTVVLSHPANTHSANNTILYVHCFIYILLIH